MILKYLSQLVVTFKCVQDSARFFMVNFKVYNAAAPVDRPVIKITCFLVD